MVGATTEGGRGRSATQFWRAIPFMPSSSWKYDGNEDVDGDEAVDGKDGKDGVYHDWRQ